MAKEPWGTTPQWRIQLSRPAFRRDGRVVEVARLESVFTGHPNVGSNPALSAIEIGDLLIPSILPL